MSVDADNCITLSEDEYLEIWKERGRLLAINAELVTALEMMVETCERVAEQQEIYDDWWHPNNDKALAVLAKACT